VLAVVPRNVETRLARLEAIVPRLPTRVDLTCFESRMSASICKLESTLHSEITKQTWRIIAVLSGLLTFLFVAVVFTAQCNS